MPYEAYFESASECLILVDAQGRILQANGAAERLFGYQTGELANMSIETLLPERLRTLHVHHRAGFMAAPRSRPMGSGLDLVALHKSGREFPVEVSLTHAARNDGHYVICLVTDISERLAREREARRTETLRTLGSLAAGVAHDINNPLTIILSRIELMLADAAQLPESVRADLEVVHHHAQRASRITRDLLELARQRPKAFEAVDLNQVVDDSLLLMSGDLARSEIRITTSLDRGLPRIMGDAVALEQVVMNLLINAREALPNSGSITITTRPHAQKLAYVQLAVTDNGPGISPDLLDKVFNFLYTTKSAGSGLGLWLSKRIMQEHSGQIEVVSEVGQGTTFLLTFPLSA